MSTPHPSTPPTACEADRRRARVRPPRARRPPTPVGARRSRPRATRAGRRGGTFPPATPSTVTAVRPTLMDPLCGSTRARGEGAARAGADRYTAVVPPDALRPRVPSAFSGTTSVDSRLLQDRLRVFAAVAFPIGASFYAVSHVLVRLGYEPPMSVAAHAALLGILGSLGGTWLYCRGASRSERSLRALDAGLLVLTGVLALFVPAGAVPEPMLRGLVMLLAVNLILFTRSIFIPSSAQRTLAVSAAAALPLALYALANESVRLSVWKVMWLLAAITVSTAGSAVIYGLRREVRHARQLGQYTLEEKIGEGGMGVVYRARHAMLRRPTAVKLLQPDRVGEASLRRFEREVQLTASLTHPNTVAVFDYGRTPDGIFYYAMEYLDGLDLEELVGGRRAAAARPRGRTSSRQVLGRARRGARHRPRPPRRQARQRHPVRARRRARRREGRRLRPRQGARGRRRRGAEPRRRPPRHASLPRAGGDPLARPPTRAPTSTRSARSRTSSSPAARVRGPHGDRGLQPAPPRRARASLREARPRPARGARGVGARRAWRRTRSGARARRPRPRSGWSAREPASGRPDDARAWWAVKGRALAARRNAHPPELPDAVTLSRAHA